ncbi:MAG: tetratricopeptide repeat protein [Sedimentisphaerales bacterium]|nr:tetratricopeptide repeat protein [Sedimentisphaerales bacterium]
MDIARKNASQHDSTQHYEILQELGDCYCSMGDYEKARKYYENAAVLEPDEAAPYVGLGVVALQNNQMDDAHAAFKVACRLDNTCAKAYSGLGMVAQQNNDYRYAFDMYLKSLELDSENLIGILGLFQTSCQMGSFEQVTHYLEMYLDMHPGDTSVMYPLAALYMKDGKIEASQNVLRDILVLDPKNKDAANLLEEIEHNLAQAQNV